MKKPDGLTIIRPDEVSQVIEPLLVKDLFGRRVRRYGVSGKTIHLYVRYADFYSSFGKQQTLDNPINQSDDNYKAAVYILDTVELQQPVMLLGVRLTNLKYNDAHLPSVSAGTKKSTHGSDNGCRQ
jgi:DNA polymerase-4